MMVISSKVDSYHRRVIAKIDSEGENAKEAVRKALYTIGNDHKQYVRSRIKAGSKTGRIYKRRGKVHQASAPGEPPANDTGRLEKSVDYKVRGAYQMEYGYQVIYGRYLELGTKKIEPRPALKIAADDLGATSRKTMQDELNRAANKL